MKYLSKIKQWARPYSETSGSIAVESAILLPLMLFCGLGSVEIATAYMNKNSLTDMSISYATILSKKGGEASEKYIKDLIDKSYQSSDRADFMSKGRLILTAVEMPVGAANPVRLWQRCSGQPQGKSFGTKYTSSTISLPSGSPQLTEGQSYIFVEAMYDSEPMTGFFFTEKDSNGKRLKRLSEDKFEMARSDIPFAANVPNPEAITAATSSCS